MSDDVRGISESILNSVKKMLGISPDISAFDVDIIANINAGISILTQVGVGPDTGFVVTSGDETYEEYLIRPNEYKMVNMFLFLKTKIAFDPPTSATLMQAYKEQMDEYLWRLQVDHDVAEE